MGEDGKKKLEGSRVVVKECNLQINGFGGGDFTGDDKVQSVIWQ